MQSSRTRRMNIIMGHLKRAPSEEVLHISASPTHAEEHEVTGLDRPKPFRFELPYAYGEDEKREGTIALREVLLIL
jgi:hypothetical protein